MHVKIVPNYMRPGVGRRPERARLPSVVRANESAIEPLRRASESALLVYPPLYPQERVDVSLLDNGSFEFALSLTDAEGRSRRVFTVHMGGSAGWGGLGVTTIERAEDVNLDEPAIGQMVDAMTTNVMTGTAAQFGFLGAYNFITPEGWSTLCVSQLNEPREDGMPSLNCLIETDWYPQNTEFRYAFKKGDAMQWTHDTPLGQVFFVPRDTANLVLDD